MVSGELFSYHVDHTLLPLPPLMIKLSLQQRLPHKPFQVVILKMEV